MPIHITSLQNPHLKELIKLEKRNERDARRLTVVEGLREVSRALAKGLVPVEAYLCPEIMRRVRGEQIVESSAIERGLAELERSGKTQLFTLTEEAFAKIAYRAESGGVLLLLPYLDTSLTNLPLKPNPFFAVIEGVEKPGNLGAILRTADAAGVDGVIVTAGVTDLHNPNVVRASLGTLFTVAVAEATIEQTIAFLRSHHIQLIAADPDAASSYTSIDMKRPSAIVMGSEALGLSDAMRRAADQLVSIPMHGMADSLNLATATALMLYEVVRQRGEGEGMKG